jgi:hypothetical protein
MSAAKVPTVNSSVPLDEWDEWDEYEEAGPMDLEDQLDAALDKCEQILRDTAINALKATLRKRDVP